MRDEKGGIRSLMQFRGSFLELLIIAAGIGLGINLIAGVIGPAIGTIFAALLGCGLVISGCAVLIIRFAPRVNRNVTLEGVLLLNNVGQIFLPIELYPLAEKVSDYFRFLFRENKAIKKIGTNRHPVSFPCLGQMKQNNLS
jgi:hypothetical protein